VAQGDGHGGPALCLLDREEAVCAFRECVRNTTHLVARSKLPELVFWYRPVQDELGVAEALRLDSSPAVGSLIEEGNVDRH